MKIPTWNNLIALTRHRRESLKEERFWSKYNSSENADFPKSTMRILAPRVLIIQSSAESGAFFMKEKKSNTQTLYELVDYLPEFCKGYLIVRANDRGINTRIGYARNLKTFFEYVIQNVPVFRGKSVKDVTPVDMGKLTVEDIDLFIGIYSESHEKPTIARMKSSISSMYNYLANTCIQYRFEMNCYFCTFH